MEIESLKVEVRTKEEEYSHAKQRWRKEVDDAIRNMKTDYHDVYTQKRLLEKQLLDFDGEKEALRAKNDRLEKELADLQTDIASKKRDMQLNLLDQEDSTAGLAASTPATANDREIARILMADLQAIRKENQTLTHALSTKNEEIKTLDTKLAQQKEQLHREKTSDLDAGKIFTLRVYPSIIFSIKSTLKFPIDRVVKLFCSILKNTRVNSS